MGWDGLGWTGIDWDSLGWPRMASHDGPAGAGMPTTPMPVRVIRVMTQIRRRLAAVRVTVCASAGERLVSSTSGGATVNLLANCKQFYSFSSSVSFTSCRVHRHAVHQHLPQLSMYGPKKR